LKKLLLNLLLLGAAVCVVAAARAAGGRPTTLSQSTQVPAQSTTVQPAPGSDETIRMPVVTEKMRRWSRIHWTLFFVRTAYSLLILWAILATGLSARMRRAGERTSRFKLIQTLAYYVMFLGVLALANAPFTAYSGYYLPHAYGLSRQSVPSWLGDIAKSYGVDIVTSVPILWGMFWLIGRQPRRWPLFAWLALVPLIAAGIFVMPLIVDPLYNKFTPMPPSPLRDRIHALAVKAGIPNAPILISDVSKQTEETNAYVTGIGSSARIVIWDTTLKRMNDREVAAIVAHEMGHYVEKHIYWGFALSVLALAAGLPLFKVVYERVLARKGHSWRLDGPADLAAIPAVYLIAGIAGFLAMPPQNAVSRYIEHRADAYGLRTGGDPRATAQAFVDLSEQNLSDPDPPAFINFWIGTHPTLKERIEFALAQETKDAR